MVDQPLERDGSFMGSRGLNEGEHLKTLQQHLLQKCWHDPKTQQCSLESHAGPWTTCLDYVLSFLAPTTLGNHCHNLHTETVNGAGERKRPRLGAGWQG